MRAALVAAALALAGPADAACRQALALGLDVSGSVDAREYRLQIEGLAAALEDPEVQARLFAMPQAPVEIAVYEWSGRRARWLIQDWVRIEGPGDLAALTATLRGHERQMTDTATAIGSAMESGVELLSRSECWQLTLDLSGDGKNNQGPEPAGLHDAVARLGATVNGLVIGSDTDVAHDRRQADIKELVSYYRTQVVTGPGAFVEAALSFEQYQAAMTRKLLRELQGLVIGRAPVAGGGKPPHILR
ncbi:MAG: DUF1194 domain-containing protein [Shimia sp.]